MVESGWIVRNQSYMGATFRVCQMTPKTKQLFWKAVVSSLAGLPISLTLNEILLPWFAWIINTQPHLLAGLYLSIPFAIASIVRIFTIDFADVKYGIRLDPVFNTVRLINWFKYIVK